MARIMNFYYYWRTFYEYCRLKTNSISVLFVSVWIFPILHAEMHLISRVSKWKDHLLIPSSKNTLQHYLMAFKLSTTNKLFLSSKHLTPTLSDIFHRTKSEDNSRVRRTFRYSYKTTFEWYNVTLKHKTKKGRYT